MLIKVSIRFKGGGVEDTHLQDLLDGVDGGGEQRLHLLVIVDVVSVADTHEKDISWQTWNGGRHGVGPDV